MMAGNSGGPGASVIDANVDVIWRTTDRLLDGFLAMLPLLVREGRAARLALRSLTPADLQEMVRRYALAPADEDRLAAFLNGRSEGNPLYAGEVLVTESRPAWGAWIETAGCRRIRRISAVAPRVGRVD